MYILKLNSISSLVESKDEDDTPSDDSQIKLPNTTGNS
jgi:hypothetical protein